MEYEEDIHLGYAEVLYFLSMQEERPKLASSWYFLHEGSWEMAKTET